MYGPDATETATKDIISGSLTAQEIRMNPETLQIAKDSAITLTDQNVILDKTGVNTWKFAGLPDKNVPFTNGESYYVRVSDPKNIRVVGGINYEVISVINLDTGKTEQLDTNGRWVLVQPER